MLYARVIFSLAIEGPFDYIVPAVFLKKIQVGSRVWVPFRTQKMLGYVIALSRLTKIKKLKEVLDVIDEKPLLDKNMLSLTRRVSQYYCCSWGEAIDTALPEPIRKGRRFPEMSPAPSKKKAEEEQGSAVLMHIPDVSQRWENYIAEIKRACEKKYSVIILVTDIFNIFKAKEIIERETNQPVLISYRKQLKGLNEWSKISSLENCIVVGTRSGIFAPVKNLGLVIIDEEENSIYKQDQVPHYHAREVAFMRTQLEKAKLVLGSSTPSLEAFYLAKQSKIKYLYIPRASGLAEIKIIDTKEFSLVARRNNIIFSKYLTDLISTNLNSAGKTLLFINRKGFATFAFCQTCGKLIKCPRCSASLMYHFKDNTLSCRFCNFKMQAPNICPDCNSGYIKYSGIGTEKIESEAHRLFPQAKIKIIDSQHKLGTESADIFIATEAITRQIGIDKFELICVLSIDNSLNRIDFRSTEKVFALLSHLANLTKNRLVVHTNLPKLHCFNALLSSDDRIFYEEELRQRKNLKFPPYQHLAFIKLRGRNDTRVNQASHDLCQRLKNQNNKNIKIISVGAAQPAKLRGKFCYQILVKGKDPYRIAKFLKINSKNFPHSGIIVTVDVDPI